MNKKKLKELQDGIELFERLKRKKEGKIMNKTILEKDISNIADETKVQVQLLVEQLNKGDFDRAKYHSNELKRLFDSYSFTVDILISYMKNNQNCRMYISTEDDYK